jgi:aldehyde dehydrogenase (NAD+)
MSYIESGKSEGATVHIGGERHGEEGYFIKPTIFTDTTPDMKIVKEEIFGPVGAVIKFKDAKGKLLSSLLHKRWILTLVYHRIDVIKQANDSTYGLAASVFSRDISRAIETAHALKAGTAWVRPFFPPTYRLVSY